MSAQHTPGPWMFGFGRTIELGDVLGVGIETEPDWTCICALSKTDAANDVDLANACLIAAAPELLQAVDALLAVFAHNFKPGISPAVDTARAAVAKATGGAA